MNNLPPEFYHHTSSTPPKLHIVAQIGDPSSCTTHDLDKNKSSRTIYDQYFLKVYNHHALKKNYSLN